MERTSTPPSVGERRHGGAVLEARGVAKRFGETQVLTGVDLDLRAGSVHGIIGANGAGKTTLMRILMGETRADAGSFVVKSRMTEASRWSGVRAAGGTIAMVHQEIPVFDNLRVYEHFALEDTGRRSWRSRARKEAAETLDRLFPGSEIAPDELVADLSLGRRQMLDIALAVHTPQIEFLVLDEPTSALDREQAEQLKGAIGMLRAEGVAVLLVTHRLEELLSLCDEITVLRDGAVARIGPASEFDADSLIVAMGGAARSESAARPPAAVEQIGAADVVARVVPPDRKGSPIEVRRGEIVGLAGLSGSGQSELVTAIARSRRSRSIEVRGRAALVSGDRRGSGIFRLWSTLRNLTVGSLRAQGRFGAVLPRTERATYGRWRESLDIRASDPHELVTTLSGGNQQKVLIARALAARPHLLALDDPTRGIDAGTKREVYELLRKSAAEGMGILWYSTEDDEMLQCQRVYVMRDGVVERELKGSELSREAIVTASFGAPGAVADLDTEAPAGARRSRRLASLRGWSLIAAVLGALVVATGIAQPSSLSASGLGVLVSSFTPLVLAAAAELMVIAVSDIDLGVGAFMGLVNAISATWLTSRPWLGVLALAGCFVLYVAQGALIAIRKVPAIIVTLGLSFVWLGLGLIVLPTPGGQSPSWLTSIGSANIPVVPEPLIISVVVAALAALGLLRTRLGVRIRAVGNNPDGYAVRANSTAASVRERMIAWSFAGILAILAGLSVTALTSSADPSASQPDTLLAIAAVIIGGGEFVGGSVEPVGAILGALMFGLLQAYLALTSINVNYTSLVEGAVLIVVLGLRLLFRPGVTSKRPPIGGGRGSLVRRRPVLTRFKPGARTPAPEVGR